MVELTEIKQDRMDLENAIIQQETGRVNANFYADYWDDILKTRPKSETPMKKIP
eukprot:UN11000